jgi:hypothetical protein
MNLILKSDTHLFYTQQISLVLNNVKARESKKLKYAVLSGIGMYSVQKIVLQQVWLIDHVV